jgi:hypothetical protein
MGGGLIQLTAYGAQDVFLTGNPQITFFKSVYRRHTNFAIDQVKQDFKSTVDFGNKVSCTISKHGDLLHRLLLQIDLPSVSLSSTARANRFRWLNWVGHTLIKSVEIEIGGKKIDKHYGDWFHIWNSLTQSPGKKEGYANAVGNVPKLTQYTLTGTTEAVQLYVPLQFWFCRNPGLALPLIALQYHEVQINIEFRTFAECSHTIGADITAPSLNAELYADYIYLDTDERRRFAQASHEYLIEQVQRVTKAVSSTTAQVNLLFDHPIKELIWVVQPDDHTTVGAVNTQVGGPQYFNYTDRLDRTYFSGTPSDPLGGGMHDPYRGSFPMSGLNVTGTGVHAGASSANPEVPSVGNSTINTDVLANANDIDIQNWENMMLSNIGIHGGVSSEQLFNHTHVMASATTASTSVTTNANTGALVTGTSDGDDDHTHTIASHTHTSAAHTHTVASATSAAAVAANYTNLPLYDIGENPIVDAYIKMGGRERFSKRKGRYFNLVQPLESHTNVPPTGINVYSFALAPEEHQPSGTCNFSKIEDAKLILTLTHSRASQARVYAVNYNVLRIMSGMCGLAYST